MLEGNGRAAPCSGSSSRQWRRCCRFDLGLDSFLRHSYPDPSSCPACPGQDPALQNGWAAHRATASPLSPTHSVWCRSPCPLRWQREGTLGSWWSQLTARPSMALAAPYTLGDPNPGPGGARGGHISSARGPWAWQHRWWRSLGRAHSLRQETALCVLGEAH